MVEFPLKTLKVKACLSQSAQRTPRITKALMLAFKPRKDFVFALLCDLGELCEKPPLILF
jgi:hypothetical protein